MRFESGKYTYIGNRLGFLVVGVLSFGCTRSAKNIAVLGLSVSLAVTAFSLYSGSLS